ncbi:kin of IRRE-like protein 2 [Bicyclus anynana]|uniref:Kin of IRRE-like protein 2 n=1 Tax=Bicyclus anynana TaxID=110368 RepID=A0A6J1MTS6_BICAN|nr:kin of IRRE-like protein 2 [Bicyclus anynana]XP_052744026.1 kin of IRRE-like protein 2 [Bicyclus anynana]XP_052744027.1 kin of IRRE-like protein 2 [Bicyclus anynana]XP_052744028.1 kin of IRRE-like protein 2 [Bicyclus anynana]
MVRDTNLCGIAVWLVLQSLIRTSEEIVESSIIQVWSAPGAETRLPCDLAASVHDVAMTMWFKDADRMPIYTVDFRNGPPVHWAIAGEFGTRTHFVLNESDPSSAHLAVDKVARYDEGVYRCRIDYIDSPTRNYRVNLTVIVPPDSPRIYDSEGREILGSIAGPFREGQDLLLSCQASGGKPAPDMSWYRGDERLASTKSGSVCQVHLPALSREASGTKLQCRVEPPLLQPQTRDVTLKLYLKPQFIRVTGGGPTRSGHERSFVCTTRGSKPAPNIDWFINSQRMDSSMTQVEVEGEVTRSVLTWRVRREDSGRQLVCRVSNPWFPAYTLEDSLTLEVLYPPAAQISMVEPKEPRLLREDEDAELLCSADASPPSYNFTFYRGTENHLIRDDPIGGIAVEGNKLVLRGLRRHHSSRYRCRAWNSEGSGLSEPLNLNVLSRPECSAGSVVQQIAGAPGGEVRARCSVSAPSTRDAGPLRFYWTYNGTKDVLPIPPSNVTIRGATSSVVHGLPTEDGDEDLGWLACWASNDIGNQREPCLFRVMPAALPEPPSNCEIEDEFLRCEPGHDGGLPQRFILEALEVRHHAPVMGDDSTMNDQGISGRGLTEAVYRASNDVTPQFPLDALSAGLYTFLVYSETPRGRSQHPAALHSIPIRTSDDLDVPGSLQTMTPMPPQPPSNDNSVALLVGASLSLVLLTILTTLCVTLVVICKKRQQPQRDPEQNTILRRSVGVSMYSGSSISPSIVPTVVVRGHRGSRVLAARWSGVLEDTPLAVLALDTRPHADTDSGHSDGELIQERDLPTTRHNIETQIE